MDEKPRLPLLH